jgi:hypothetical protein
MNGFTRDAPFLSIVVGSARLAQNPVKCYGIRRSKGAAAELPNP